MIQADLVKKLRNVVCLGAHSDDIEIGCGGTLLRLTQENPSIKVWWTVFSATPTRAAEARKGAKLFLSQAKASYVHIHDFRDGHFPSQHTVIKEQFERLKGECKPDLIFTHQGNDHHQDHKTLSTLTWNTWRDHLIFEYEVPKYDGDLSHPNLFVPLSRATCVKKARLIRKAFGSQARRQWFDQDAFMALPRLRGIEGNSPTAYAEAFHSRKFVI